MKTLKKTFALVLALLTMIACLSGCSKTGAPAPAEGEDPVHEPASTVSYTPPKNMTVLIAFGAGGGVDTFGRQSCFFMNDLDLTKSNFIYENQSGGSGQVGWGAVIEQHGGDESYLIPAASNSLCSGKISGKKYSYLDMTCVAKICCDYRVLVTSSESNFDSLEDLVAEGGKRELVASVAGLGTVSHMVIEELAKQANIKIRVVPYESPEDVTSVLGNQVDFTVASPGELAEYISNGDLLALSVASEEPLDYFPGTPTFRDCGYDIVQKTTRGILMPAGVSEEAVEYWRGLIEEVCKSDKFVEEYIEPYYMTLDYADGASWKDELDVCYAEMEAIMTELGMAA